MSDAAHTEEAHTGPIKTPAQLLWTSFFAFVVPVFIIIGLVYFVTSGNKPAAGAVDSELATAQRIQKVGVVEIRDANRPLAAGADVYKAQCAACHDAGLAGAPKMGDAGAWAARIATGYDALLNSALKGKGAMGAQGGGAYRDAEGQPLNGDKVYRLRVPTDVPAKQYWAVTAYDLATAGFLREAPRLGVDSYGGAVEKNADGSVDVYFASSEPPGKEANWVYTEPGKPWFTFFRFYGPEKALLERTWQLPDIEPVGSASRALQ